MYFLSFSARALLHMMPSATAAAGWEKPAALKEQRKVMSTASWPPALKLRWLFRRLQRPRCSCRQASHCNAPMLRLPCTPWRVCAPVRELTCATSLSASMQPCGAPCNPRRLRTRIGLLSQGMALATVPRSTRRKDLD